jgi:hypothetical protein
MDRPTEIHVASIKKIMRYFKGTHGFGISYKANASKDLDE